MSTPHEKSNPFELAASLSRPLDLDGMTVMIDVNGCRSADTDVGMTIDLEPVAKSQTDDNEVEELPWANTSATATWAPLMEEVSIYLPGTRAPLTTIIIDLRSQLALPLPSNPTHGQPRPSLLIPIQRYMSSLEEEQRAIWQSLQLPLRYRLSHRLQGRHRGSRSSVPGDQTRLEQFI